MNVLVTGGAGYIASHTIVELLGDGHTVVAVDNLSNSSKESILRVERITGQKIPFYEIDVANKKDLVRVFNQHKIDAVCHFAGLKSVSESVSIPLQYYHNNINTTINLCEVMRDNNVSKIVFSSSASVYGVPQELPLDEHSPRGKITNPYGQTKAMIEQILIDLAATGSNWDITILRYFNPIGAHESGLIGEDPNGPPNNLLPYISQVAVGKFDVVNIYGNDYDTPDGTGVRDYIHVVDLARGHVAALKRLSKGDKVDIYNLGTGKGTSVLELHHAFELACGRKIPYKIHPRRPGDVDSSYSNATKARRELGWSATHSIHDACNDSWQWQSKNPNGYSAVAEDKNT